MRLGEGLRDTAAATLAGAAAGALTFGVGGRLAMRLSGALSPAHLQGVMTSEKGSVGLLTWGGTLQVIVLGAILGIMGAAFYLALKPALPTKRRGLVLALLSLLVVGGSALDVNNPDFRAFGNPLANILAFAALPLLWGPLMVHLDERWRPRLPTRRLALPLYAPLLALLLALGAMGPFLMAEDHPLVTLAIGALSIVTVLARLPPTRRWATRALVVPGAIGLVGTAVAVAGIV